MNREQEQARQLAESYGPDGRAGRDLAWIVAVTVVLACLALAGQLLARPLPTLDDVSADGRAGLVALLVLIPLGATVYAVLRYRDTLVLTATVRQLADHDPLTGLPDRRQLPERLTRLIGASERDGRRCAVLHLDLDGFQRINLAHGYDVGDEVMIATAERLRRAAGDEHPVIRLAGDEFVVLAPDVLDAQGAQRLASRLVQAVEEPVARGAETIGVTASVGVALAEPRCRHPDEVLGDAEAALRQAKVQGRGTVALFDRARPGTITPAVAARRLEEALEAGEFRLAYQPIVSLWTRRLVGVEALLRWDDPARGTVAPHDFMPLLEESGLIVPVGHWVFHEVCAQSVRWQAGHPDRPALNVKVNVTARQLAQADVVDHLDAALRAAGADPANLCLEITEGALAHDLPAAWSTLRAVKELGLTLALDDFGTGYSSLAYLRRFALDLLQIDKAFVDGLGHSREDETIVEHVIGMAKALGIVTVAEGVEREEQVEMLRALHCDLAQGYYFSHPQPAHVIDRLLATDGNKEEWRPDGAATLDPEAPAPGTVVDISRFRRATSSPHR